MCEGETSKHLNGAMYLYALRRLERVILLIFYCPSDLSDRILHATYRNATNHSIRRVKRFAGRAEVVVGKVGQV